MKAVLGVVVVLGIGFVVLKFAMSSADKAAFDPDKQGVEARTTAGQCTSWTEVLDRVGPPRKWRQATSDFDFHYIDRFEDSTPDTITAALKDNKYEYGFSFLYQFSDAVTFAVNFDRKGSFSTIQSKEGKGELIEKSGG